MREALVVAVTDYQHDDLRRLTAPATDAEQLSAALLDQSVGGFDRVQVLNNPSSSELAAALERTFNERSRRSTDTVLFYFSGHGVKDLNGRLFLASAMTDPELLLSTSVSAAFLNDLMQRSPSRTQIVILDCCFAGAFGREFAKGGREVGIADELPAAKGRVVLAGSSAIEFSFETAAEQATARASVFTEALVSGLRSGDADLDRDGLVTVDELFTFACDQLAARSARQRPVKFAIDQDGHIVVARNPTRASTVALVDRAESMHANGVIGRRTGVGAFVALVAVVLAAALVAFGIWRLTDDEERAGAYTDVVTSTAPPTSTSGLVTTTVAGGPTTTLKREYPSVIGRGREDAEQILQSKGWKTSVSPAAVTDRPLYAVITQRVSGDTVSLVVADQPTCAKDPAKYTYCDGRPVAYFRGSTSAASITPGTRLDLTDLTAGSVTSRRWRWNQGGSSGYFAETTSNLSITVGGKAGETLVVTIEVTNSKGSDQYSIGWPIA
jgi:hypothetical protein